MFQFILIVSQKLRENITILHMSEGKFKGTNGAQESFVLKCIICHKM